MSMSCCRTCMVTSRSMGKLEIKSDKKGKSTEGAGSKHTSSQRMEQVNGGSKSTEGAGSKRSQVNGWSKSSEGAGSKHTSSFHSTHPTLHTWATRKEAISYRQRTSWHISSCVAVIHLIHEAKMYSSRWRITISVMRDCLAEKNHTSLASSAKPSCSRSHNVYTNARATTKACLHNSVVFSKSFEPLMLMEKTLQLVQLFGFAQPLRH